jgi:hypothetical protein
MTSSLSCRTGFLDLSLAPENGVSDFVLHLTSSADKPVATAKLDLIHFSDIYASSTSENEETNYGEKKRMALDRLVLPKGHKEMILSLIAQHFRNKESGTDVQLDIVRGKGQSYHLLS